MAGKVTVATPIDEDLQQNLDEFCSEIHRTRAEVLRGLLYALLVPGKQFIYEDWREVKSKQMNRMGRVKS